MEGGEKSGVMERWTEKTDGRTLRLGEGRGTQKAKDREQKAEGDGVMEDKLFLNFPNVHSRSDQWNSRISNKEFRILKYNLQRPARFSFPSEISLPAPRTASLNWR